jgi:hypothetical protein
VVKFFLRVQLFHRSSDIKQKITVPKVKLKTSTSKASPLAATPALLSKTSI